GIGAPPRRAPPSKCRQSVTSACVLPAPAPAQSTRFSSSANAGLFRAPSDKASLAQPSLGNPAHRPKQAEAAVLSTDGKLSSAQPPQQRVHGVGKILPARFLELSSHLGIGGDQLLDPDVAILSERLGEVGELAAPQRKKRRLHPRWMGDRTN